MELKKSLQSLQYEIINNHESPSGPWNLVRYMHFFWEEKAVPSTKPNVLLLLTCFPAPSLILTIEQAKSTSTHKDLMFYMGILSSLYFLPYIFFLSVWILLHGSFEPRVLALQDKKHKSMDPKGNTEHVMNMLKKCKCEKRVLLKFLLNSLK